MRLRHVDPPGVAKPPLSNADPFARGLSSDPADLALAQAEPERYLVLDASRPADELSHEIQDRLRDLLPDPVPSVAEANTGSFPAIVD